MIDTNQIVEKINELAVRHQALGNNLEDLEDAEWLEAEAQGLISDYCEQVGLQVEGFPHEKRKLALDNDEYDEDYFCKERFQLYIDILTLENEVVAGLNWHFVNSFWPGEFNDNIDFIESIKARIASGVFYDLKF
jgi:hypothetical protein